jgi:hypothetical protein
VLFQQARWYPITTSDGTNLTLPSVTTILDAVLPKPAIAMAAAANPLKAASNQTAARHRGDFIDAYVKARLRRTTPPTDVRYVRWSLNADHWINQVLDRGTFLDCDLVVHNLNPGYAGTLDVLVTLSDFGLVLVDLKTIAYRVFDDARHRAELQCAGYSQALAFSHGIKVDAIAPVFISPYGLDIKYVHGVELQNLVSEFNTLTRSFGAAYASVG